MTNEMSSRSKREVKPTIKYLNYCSRVGNAPAGTTQARTAASNRVALTVKAVGPSATTKVTQPAATKRKKDDDEDAPSSRSAKRRSGRQPKPTQKLMEFIQTPPAPQTEATPSNSQPSSNATASTTGTQLSNGRLARDSAAKEKTSKAEPAKKPLLTRRITVLGSRKAAPKPTEPPSKNALRITKSLSIPLTDVAKFDSRKLLTSKDPKLTGVLGGASSSSLRPKPQGVSTTFKSRPKATAKPLTHSQAKVTRSLPATRTVKERTTRPTAQSRPARAAAAASTNQKPPLQEEEDPMLLPLDCIKVEEETEGLLQTVTPPPVTPADPNTEIRSTLRKFLVMGTKVATSISNSLKQNERSLLASSSSFEKKCVSLVYALAHHAQPNLEEEDMEKVLNLLDEEQEARRAYRHCLLESLKVSHLTNMALYTHMLKLLKSL